MVVTQTKQITHVQRLKLIPIWADTHTHGTQRKDTHPQAHRQPFVPTAAYIHAEVHMLRLKDRRWNFPAGHFANKTAVDAWSHRGEPLQRCFDDYKPANDDW